MENLRDLRRRRRSVISTQQITRAMKMVSAAKLRRAQEILLNARPYVRNLEAVVENLLRRMPDAAHPLLQRREGPRWALLAIAGDRGLSGAYNGNVFKRAEHFLREHPQASIALHMFGKKGQEYFKRRKVSIAAMQEGIEKRVSPEFAADVIEPFLADYAAGRLDRLVVIFTRFHSALHQELIVQTLLPVPGAAGSAGAGPESAAPAAGADFLPLFAPSVDAVLESLLPRFLIAQFYVMLLEAQASEHGARMTAMENATNNASELIGNLTLQLNRARQASITKEILEIVGGAEALRG
jgi:F-type H+-transporting ATPase subunit gamma